VRAPGVDVAAIDRIRAFAEEVPTRCAALRPKRADIAIASAVPPSPPAPPRGRRVALHLTGQNETHAVSYATEAGLFQEAGSPAVVVGPGDIAQAHAADEWIARDQIDKCMIFLERLGAWAERGARIPQPKTVR
jgi:acetylornithine deacetylase